MSLVAAFVWRKSPRPNICFFIYDNKNIKIISPPKMFFFSNKLFSFRKEVRQIIKKFIFEIKKLSPEYSSVLIEYKIVFRVIHIPWIKVSSESRFVHNYFMKSVSKLQNRLENIKLQPQLKKKLSGRSLKIFKRELRKMNLVSRKKDTAYEYYLWMVALHATPKSYAKKLGMIKKKLLDLFWEKP